MRTLGLTDYLDGIRRRAEERGVVSGPVDAMRNKGGERTANKRMLLARAAARRGDGASTIISYY